MKAIYSDDAFPGIYTASWVSQHPFVRLFDVVGGVLRSMPAGFAVAEYAAALGQARLGPGTMFELQGPAFVAFFAQITASTDPAFFDVVTAPAGLWTDADVAEVVRGIRCPVHVAYGDVDRGSLVPLAEIDALASAGVDVSRTHFAGAGHMISPLFPAESNADIRSFLSPPGVTAFSCRQSFAHTTTRLSPACLWPSRPARGADRFPTGGHHGGRSVVSGAVTEIRR